MHYFIDICRSNVYTLPAKTMKKAFFTLFISTLLSIPMLSQLKTAMTFNIRLDIESDKENNWNYRKAELVKLIENYKPDVLGIQEALPNQIKYLDSSLINYSYVGMGREGGKKGEHNAIFFNQHKFKVIKNNTFWLSETPKQASFGWDAACKRIYTYALIENLTTKKQFWVFNTHFDHKGDKARKESAKLLVLKIRELTKSNNPVILMGDFNCTPEHISIKTISKLLSDTYDLAKNKPINPTGTFCSFDTEKIATKRIDYIFTNGLKVKKYRHINDRRKNNLRVSDHLPVIVEFKH